MCLLLVKTDSMYLCLLFSSNGATLNKIEVVYISFRPRMSFLHMPPPKPLKVIKGYYQRSDRVAAKFNVLSFVFILIIFPADFFQCKIDSVSGPISFI